MTTTDLIRESAHEIEALRDHIDGADSFLTALSEFIGVPVQIDRPRRSITSLDEVQKVKLRESADIDGDLDESAIRSLVRGLYHRRTFVRVGVTVVASIESSVIPRRIPESVRDELFHTATPLREALDGYGVRRHTHRVATRWPYTDGTRPTCYDTDILYCTAQLDLELPVAWITETVHAAALHVREGQRHP